MLPLLEQIQGRPFALEMCAQYEKKKSMAGKALSDSIADMRKREEEQALSLRGPSSCQETGGNRMERHGIHRKIVGFADSS